MPREAEALKALAAAMSRRAAPPDAGSLAAMQKFYAAVGPQMHPDLVATPTPSPLDADVLRFNFDEGHAGRFSVPRSDGGSLAFDYVMARPDPAAYIMSSLAFRDAAAQRYTGREEVAIFCPGLNTLHQKVPGETTMPERLQFYVKVVGLPMAQMHTGTSFDQGDVHIDTANAPALKAVLDALAPQLPSTTKPRYNPDGSVTWAARQIDNIQVTLSEHNIIDTPIKANMRRLLETTRDPAAKPFALVTYSRGSVEVEAALRRHVDDSEKAGESSRDIRDRLRRRATVVVIGGASRNYPDGPAYIHLSSWTDPLTSTTGTDSRRPQGAGADAVFLNCDSPYHPDAFDNHNFGAVTAQYLALVLGITGATGFRDLWNKARAGANLVPDDADRLTRAMIQLTRGYDWLWEPDAAWKDIPMGALPDDASAAATIRERMGDKFFDRVVKNFKTN